MYMALNTTHLVHQGRTEADLGKTNNTNAMLSNKYYEFFAAIINEEISKIARHTRVIAAQSW
jgi:hypothetical protein